MDQWTDVFISTIKGDIIDIILI